MIVIIGLPSVEQQHRALDEEDVALGDDRVGRAVALDGVVGVEEHAVDGLVAADVDDPQRLAGRDDARPRRPGPHHLVVHDRASRRGRLLLGVEVGPRRLGGRGPRRVVGARRARPARR